MRPTERLWGVSVLTLAGCCRLAQLISVAREATVERYSEKIDLGGLTPCRLASLLTVPPHRSTPVFGPSHAPAGTDSAEAIRETPFGFVGGSSRMPGTSLGTGRNELEGCSLGWVFA